MKNQAAGDRMIKKSFKTSAKKLEFRIYKTLNSTKIPKIYFFSKIKP